MRILYPTNISLKQEGRKKGIFRLIKIYNNNNNAPNKLSFHVPSFGEFLEEALPDEESTLKETWASGQSVQPRKEANKVSEKRSFLV